MTKGNGFDIKLRRLHIVNYKGLDEIELEFPMPTMADDPDVMVMGSRNGLGKTSVLECCALLLIVLIDPPTESRLQQLRATNILEMILRSGESKAKIEGDIVFNNKAITFAVTLDESGVIKLNPPIAEIKKHLKEYRKTMDDLDEFLSIIKGMSPNPLLSEPFLYFHSYRKVQEGSLNFGMIVDRQRGQRIVAGDRSQRRIFYGPDYEIPMSTFKLTILRALMSRAQLFEKLDDEQSGGVLEKLNELVKRYAGGTIQKLRPSEDNTVEFRIQPDNNGPSFSFDGLSSGQKEIIATLFLIWYYARNKSCVVLIDEPELHLNPEWHRDFIRQLNLLAPHNQYIIATHSVDIFDSVYEDRRLLIQSSVRNEA